MSAGRSDRCRPGVSLPMGRTDLSIATAGQSSHGVLLSLLFSQRWAAQLNAMRVVDDAVQDRIGQSGIADQVVPAVHRDLAGDQGGATPATILGDFEHVAALLWAERLEGPVVEDE